MPEVRYDGPGGRLVAFGKTLLRGETGEFTQQETRQLLAQPHIHVTVVRQVRTRTTIRPRVNTGGRDEPEAREGEGRDDPDTKQEE